VKSLCAKRMFCDIDVDWHFSTSWFDYMFAPVEELEEVTKPAGWDLVEYEPGAHPYRAVLRLHEARAAT
jgi:hypothetical protein